MDTIQAKHKGARNELAAINNRIRDKVTPVSKSNKSRVNWRGIEDAPNIHQPKVWLADRSGYVWLGGLPLSERDRANNPVAWAVAHLPDPPTTISG